MSFKFAKIASILIISIAFISCSSKQKNTTTATTAATQDAAKKDGKKDAKSATTAPNAASVVCKNGSDTRTLGIVTKESGCEVSYTKFNQATTPASSSKGTAHCEAVIQKIKTNLENAGFKCE